MTNMLFVERCERFILNIFVRSVFEVAVYSKETNSAGRDRRCRKPQPPYPAGYPPSAAVAAAAAVAVATAKLTNNNNNNSSTAV